MRFFKPIVQLRPDFNPDYYSMEALVIVPSQCFYSQGTKLGWPHNVVGIPSAEPIQLLIGQSSGFCPQVVTTLQYIHNSIPVSEGKDSLVALSVLDGQTVGSTSVLIPKSDPKQFTELVENTNKTGPSGAHVVSVYAWINAMPGGDPELHVIVTMWAPLGGYSYDLTGIGPYGFTGRTYALQMVAKAPQTGPTIPTTIPVHFSMPLKDGETYDSVMVFFEGGSHLAPVEFAE